MTKQLQLVGAGIVLLLVFAARADELPVNRWVNLEQGGLDSRRGGALVYVPSINRFLVAMGAQRRYDLKPTPPYSETTFNFEKRQWENWLPKGKAWGIVTGPVETPSFKGRTGLEVDETGILRPNLRGGYGTRVDHLYAYDRDRGKLLFGVDMQYDPVARAWQKLSFEKHPGTSSLAPFDIESVDRPAWSQMCYDPINKEFLLCGGAKTVTETGSPGTWVFSPEKNEWRKLTFGSDVIRKLATAASALKQRAHAMVTRCRNRFYRTELPAHAEQELSELLTESIAVVDIELLAAAVDAADVQGYEKTQTVRARKPLAEAIAVYEALLERIDEAVAPADLTAAEEVEAAIRRAALAMASEPPPRCYSPMAFDPVSRKIVLFGGFALDRSLADTWTYDPATRSWQEQRPAIGPSPRLSHGLLFLPKAKKILLIGGWQAKVATGCNVFYGDALIPEAWTYNVVANKWTLVKQWSAELNDRTGPFPPPVNDPQVFAADTDDVVLTLAEPFRKTPATWACRFDATVTDTDGTANLGVQPGTEHFAGGKTHTRYWHTAAAPPDPRKVENELRNLPANKWIPRPTGGLTRMPLSYSSAAIDTDRDEIVLWAGGHGSYHGTEITRYALATDRWCTNYHAQFPLSFAYFATSGNYAYGFRPWMGVHPWAGYAYDPAIKKLVLLTGCETFTHVFNPDVGDHERPWALLPRGGGNPTTKACATPHGACAWVGGRGAPVRLYRLDAAKKAWVALPIQSGNSQLSAPDYYDGMTYDSKRDLLVLAFGANRKDQKGTLLTYDMKTAALDRHEPKNRELAPNYMREVEYIPGADLLFEMRGMAWDPKANGWIKLDIDSTALNQPHRAPRETAGNSQGLVYDPKRELLWTVNRATNVCVMRLVPRKTRK